jgi:ParB-like chromosome segregation protein Spo0J
VAKKKTVLSDLLFDEVNPYGAVIGDVVSRPVERFPLEAIRPDPGQPRRLLPGDLAEIVNRGEMAPAAAVREWLRRAAADPTLAGDVRELQRLASAIEQHGLINPITIRPAEGSPGRYLIVTGERRYWAHVLLALERRQIREGEALEPPDSIKATLVAPGVSIRAHQIVENLMREDINVVEKAHGLNALREELSQTTSASSERTSASSERTSASSERTSASSERTSASSDAYRRHPDAKDEGGARLVPWKAVEDALDMSRQYRLRIISVLDLSAEAQQLVDRHDLAEATIRPIIEKLKPHPELQIKALHQVIAWQEAEARGEGEGRQIVPSVRALVDRLLLGKQAPAAGRGPVEGLDFNKLRQQVRGALRAIEKLDPKARQDLARAADSQTGAAIVNDLHALRDQIDAVLEQLGINN